MLETLPPPLPGTRVRVLATSDLGVRRPFGSPDYQLVVAELRPGELEAAVAAHWTLADPGNRAADALWWNWCRMPAGVDRVPGAAASVAMIAGAASPLGEWLGREPDVSPAGVSAADALRETLGA